MSKFTIPRRTFLRGAGASIMLPFLDAMVPSRAHAADINSPRYVAIFMSLGIFGLGYDPTKNNASRYYKIAPYAPGGTGVWVPKQTGPFSAPLPPVLAPLESMKQKVTIISGLGTMTSDILANTVSHSAATTNWLTSAYSSRADASAKNNLPGGGRARGNNNPPSSIDQHIANSIGITPGTSLVFCPTGYDFSEAEEGGHAGYISYNSRLSAGGSSIVPKTLDPRKAFNTLFSNCKANAPTTSQADAKSILDYVLESIKKVQKNLGSEDKSRLDSYFQNIRDVEAGLLSGVTECPTPPNPMPPFSGGTLDWVTTVNMMADVIALAVSSGVMPIATLMSDVEANNAPYAARVDYLSNYIGLNGQKVRYRSSGIGTHFDIAHPGNRPENTQVVEEHIAYSQMIIAVVRRLMQKLDSMPVEPNGFTPLDNTIIQVGACHSHSGLHNTHNLPTLLAGGKKYGLQQGRTVAFPQMTDIGDLYYTMLKAMGMADTSFNGHSKILNGIFA